MTYLPRRSAYAASVDTARKPTALSSEWRRFLFVRVPLLLLAMLAVCQGLDAGLRHARLRRSNLDDLALAVESDPTAFRVVVLGDSITRETRRFQLGRGPHDVGNLATIGWTGAAAELFLLERYLRHHPAPHYVVYAVAPDDLQTTVSARVVRYYDWRVYDRPDERAFLREFVPGIDARDWLPAAFDIQERILEPLLSLAARGPPLMPAGVRAADPLVQPEPASDNQSFAASEQRRMGRVLRVGPLQQAVFGRLCTLSRVYGFRIAVVWPPVPPGVLQAWRQTGQFASLNAQVRALLGTGCNAGAPFDINTIRSYTNFNRDALHLRGEHWNERYAADLGAYIATLPGALAPIVEAARK
jgi:hypothetical protein